MEHEECMFRICLINGGLSGVFNSYILVCNFIHHDKSNIFTRVFKTAPIH